MSRSGYNTYCIDNWALIRWRGRVTSAMRGKRGQRLLRAMLARLDEMPEKKLIVKELKSEDGQVCALGAAGDALGVDLSGIDPDDPAAVAEALDIAEPLAREVTFINDECGHYLETPETRHMRVRAWVVQHLKEESIDESQ